MEIDDQKKKSVNNYRQLATIIWGWSTISHNWQQFARDYLRGQQLATIINNYFGVVINYRQLATICERLFKWSKISNNCFEVVNHTAKQIVPFRAKNYQQLPTIIWGWSTIINN